MTPDTLHILLLTPQIPYPPEQGAALRNFNILKHLARHYRVTLVGFGTPALAPPELGRLCEQVVAIVPPARSRRQRVVSLLRPEPDLAVRLRSAAFGAAVQALVRRQAFALVQCEALELYRYAGAVAAPLILDAHNAEWRLQQRAYTAALLQRRPLPAAYSLLQWRKLARYEGAAVRRAAHTLAVSTVDQADLRRIAPAAPVTVVPNGVDADLYAPQPDITEEEDSLLFAGKMDFRPNVEGAVWLATAVMPLVWRRRPNVTLTLFGSQPAPAVRQLAADRRITVTGHVPGVAGEKLALARAAVVTVPLFSGGGTRLKVPIALAMARPLVSTPLGAAGYDVQSGRELLLANTPRQFADALLRLLDDRALARRLGGEGMATVRRRYTWERLLPALDQVYEDVLHG